MSNNIDGSAIDKVLKAAVDAGAVPHVAAIAANADGVIYEGAAGPREPGSGDALSTGTQFRIMSMTKMVATTAALQLKEQGKLDFEAPIESYVPEWAEVQVLEGWDGDTPKLRAPKTQATVHNLVTHTSGLGYWFWSEDLKKYEAVTGVPNVVPGTMDAFKAPLVHDPGERFTYGINTDWLGRVVEAAGGKGLDVAVKEGIAGPLGMGHTGFSMSDEQKANAVQVCVKGEDGTWSGIGNVISEAPEWWAGGHGLYSTPQDYIRFERALLRGGELDGERILKQETVDAAFSDQLRGLSFPAEIPTADAGTTDALNVGPGYTWGYGLLINNNDVPGARKAGSGAWAGLFNTHFWVDRTTGICASIYTNSLPFITPEAFGLYADFEAALYASL